MSVVSWHDLSSILRGSDELDTKKYTPPILRKAFGVNRHIHTDFQNSPINLFVTLRSSRGHSHGSLRSQKAPDPESRSQTHTTNQRADWRRGLRITEGKGSWTKQKRIQAPWEKSLNRQMCWCLMVTLKQVLQHCVVPVTWRGVGKRKIAR